MSAEPDQIARVDTETKEAARIESELDAFERDTGISPPGRDRPAAIMPPEEYQVACLAFAYWRKVQSHTELLDEALDEIRVLRAVIGALVDEAPLSGLKSLGRRASRAISLIERARTRRMGR